VEAVGVVDDGRRFGQGTTGEAQHKRAE
jgi:hypothetical protein